MNFALPSTASEIAALLGAELVGDPALSVQGFTALAEVGEGQLSFMVSREYGSALEGKKKCVLLTTRDCVQEQWPVTFLVVENPRKAFNELVKSAHSVPRKKGISPAASIHPTAQVADDAYVGPQCVIEAGARIGAGSCLEARVYVGENVSIGELCDLHPQVVVMAGTVIGNRVRIFSGAVLGSEGFGLMGEGADLSSVPHIGKVIIEDGVRIGANCTIDRGTLGETRIGKGSQLDDQVHVGHNCKIGQYCILCAQVGLAGSVVLEDKVVLGGQVGVKDHVVISKGARVGAQSGVGTDLPGNEDYFMSPALPLKESIRIVRHMRRLPKFSERLRRLEARLGLEDSPEKSS